MNVNLGKTCEAAIAGGGEPACCHARAAAAG